MTFSSARLAILDDDSKPSALSVFNGFDASRSKVSIRSLRVLRCHSESQWSMNAQQPQFQNRSFVRTLRMTMHCGAERRCLVLLPEDRRSKTNLSSRSPYAIANAEHSFGSGCLGGNIFLILRNSVEAPVCKVKPHSVTVLCFALRSCGAAEFTKGDGVARRSRFHAFISHRRLRSQDIVQLCDIPRQSQRPSSSRKTRGSEMSCTSLLYKSHAESFALNLIDLSRTVLPRPRP